MLCKGTYNNTKKNYEGFLGRGKNLRAEELCQMELERESKPNQKESHTLEKPELAQEKELPKCFESRLAGEHETSYVTRERKEKKEREKTSRSKGD